MDKVLTAENPLGYVRVGRLLARYAIPSIISLIINSLYNMVDQIFIGQGVGFLGNGATNIIAPISTIAIAVSTLFGDGVAAYFSLHLGKGEPDKAAKGVGNSLISSGAISVIFAVLDLLFLRPLCILFGATENILPYAIGYGRIIVIGFPFVILGTVINSVIRTDGSPKYAMFAMMIGAIINTALDPVFIFVFHWGVEGAAFATILSQFIGFLCNFAYLFRFKSISLKKTSFQVEIRMVGWIASLGFASCFNNLTSTVVAMVSNNLLTKYGALTEFGPDIPITTFGLCMKVSMIAFSVGIGVASGSQPILGFNYGAEKYKRVKQTFLLSAGICTLITIVAWIIFQCFHIYLLLTFLNGLQMCTGVLFQAIGQPVKAAAASLSKQLLFYVPAMLIVSRITGLTGVLWAGPIADTLAFVLCLILCVHEIKKMDGMAANA